VPGYESRSWYGILGPAKLPKPVLSKLHGQIAAIIGSQDFASKFATEGVVPGDMTPEQFGQFIQHEIKRYAAVVKAANLKP
jgi:tripartite-type tricarboxylate transporter receptor subunit TctC